MKTRWWMVSSTAIGALMLMLGVGNLIDPEDTGPLYGQLVLLAVMAAGAAMIGYGMVLLLRRKKTRGAKLVGLGVAPGAVGIAFFWFWPAVAVGLLALASSGAAFRAAGRPERQAAMS